MKMAKFLLPILFGVAVAACGGGGGGGATPDATDVTISGSVVKGPMTGASVAFFGLNADGSKAAQLGTATTDSGGNFTITLTPAPTTPFLAEASGGTYVDEATGAAVTLTATDKLQAVLPAGTTRATITPLTNIAAARAQALAAGGTPLATAVDSSNTSVGSQYGIANIVTVLPPAANDAASVAVSTRDERLYALVLAGIAQQASSLGVRAIDLANALAEDAKDGILDGQNGAAAIDIVAINGASLPLPATAGTADIQLAINVFLASVNNQTSLAQVSIPLTPVNLGVSTAGSLYSTLPVLSAAISGQTYTAQLTATGGTPPYTCALQAGSSLPPEYSLVSSTCQITGTAPLLGAGTTMSISAPFTVTLTDSAVPPVSVNLVALRVTAVAPNPTLIPVAGEMTVNVSGSTQVAAAIGGTPPFYFAHDSFAYGAHPLGTILDVNGNLTGTPSQTGVFNFSVCVIDLVGAQDCRMTSVTVNPAVTLTVATSGTGSGTVTSSPAGINCGATCSASLESNSSATLTATPATGSTFTGWSGACSGTGSCLVTMNTNQTVTATFDSTPPLTGTWTGTWAWSGPGSNGCQFSDGGAFSMTLTQTGTSFSGDTSGEGIQWRDDATCALMYTIPGTGTASGTISGTAVNLSFDLGGVFLTGTATLNNNTLTASFVRDTGGSGSFTVTRQ